MSLNGWEIQLIDTASAKQAVLWNPNSQSGAVACVVQEEVEGKDEITFVSADLEHRSIFQDVDTTYALRLVNLQSPTEIRTYDIDDTALVHEDDQERVEVTGQRIWVRLKTRYLYNESVTYTNIGIGALILEILNTSGANTEFQLGTIANNTEDVDTFEVNNESALALYRKLCKKMGRELTVDESTSPKMALSFPTAQGNSGSNARMIYGINSQGIEKKVDKTEIVTRMYGTGGGEPAVKLSASSLAGGNDYIDAADYNATTHNYVGHYQNTDIIDITNLIADASNPDLSGTYTAGLCAGWSKISTPTVAEVLKTAEPTVVEYGTKAMRVTCSAAGEGVSVAWVCNQSSEQTIWVNISVESLTGAAGIKIEASDGTARRINGDGLFTIGNTTKQELRGFRTPSSTSGTLKITAIDDAATFVIDAAMIFVGTEFTKFVKGDMVDVLYNETSAELAKVNTAKTTYTVRALDLYATDPKKWTDYQFNLGDTVKVEDQKIGIEVDQRIKARTWNIIEPRNSGFQVGDVRTRLGQIIVRDQTRITGNVEQTRTTRAVASTTAAAVNVERPVSSLRLRIDCEFTADSVSQFTYDAGTLFVGDEEFDLAGATISGLSNSTVYYVYFDMDVPASVLQVTSTYATSIGPRKVIVGTVETGASGESGMTILPADGRPQLSGNDVISGVIDTTKAQVQRTGASSAKVAINENGIEGFNTSGTRTTFIDIDGSGQLGAGASPISWTTAGAMSVPGGIVTTGLNADNITTGTIDASVITVSNIDADEINSGTLVIGASPSAASRITMAMATEDIVVYRGSSAVVDIGDISQAGWTGDTGIRIDDPDGNLFLEATGAITDGAISSRMLVIVDRGTDEGITGGNGEYGYAFSLDYEANTSGANGPLQGIGGTVNNADGVAHGVLLNSVVAETGSNAAYGLRIVSMSAAGTAYGLHIVGSDKNYMEGELTIAGLATETLEIIDCGSSGATEQDWIEVECAGAQGYIRVFASK